MKSMKNTISILGLSIVLLTTGCGSDDEVGGKILGAKNPNRTLGEQVSFLFDEGSLSDKIDNAEDAVVNGATLTKDRKGNENSAYSFDGVNDYIEVTMKNPIAADSTMSISIWAKTTEYEARKTYTLFSKQGDFSLSTSNRVFTDPFSGDQYSENSVFYFIDAIDNYNLEASHTPEKDKWHHYAIVKNSLIIKIYIDGKLSHRQSLYGDFNDDGEKLYLGATFNKRSNGSSISESVNSYFKGDLDDFRLYNTALSEEEIKQLAEDK